MIRFNHKRFGVPCKQRGFTLVLSLVLFVAIASLVFSALNTSKTNLQITANMQVQREMETIGQRAIEAVLTNINADYDYLTTSTPSFTYYAGSATSDGTPGYTANVAISCLYKAQDADISTESSSDALQITAGNPNLGPAWFTYNYDLAACVVESNEISGGSVVIHQGIEIRTTDNVACCVQCCPGDASCTSTCP